MLVLLGPDEVEEASSMKCPFIEMDTEEEHIKVKEGHHITFVCRVGGYPQPRLVFYKDEKRIRPNENIRIGRNSIMKRSQLKVELSKLLSSCYVHLLACLLAFLLAFTTNRYTAISGRKNPIHRLTQDKTIATLMIPSRFL